MAEALEEVDHEIRLPSEETGEELKTFSLSCLRLNVLSHEKKIAGISLCARTGACPCEAPCEWAEQALDALQRDGWPSLGQLHQGFPLIGTPD